MRLGCPAASVRSHRTSIWFVVDCPGTRTSRLIVSVTTPADGTSSPTSRSTNRSYSLELGLSDTVHNMPQRTRANLPGPAPGGVMPEPGCPVTGLAGFETAFRDPGGLSQAQ